MSEEDFEKAPKKRKFSERTHSKIKIKELILHALENNSNPEALVWTTRGSVFAVNGEKFTEYYQIKSDSSANWKSIKNRLTRSKSGFYALEISVGNMPPFGYHKLYSHIDWRTPLPVDPAPIEVNSSLINQSDPTSDDVIIAETLPDMRIDIGQIFHEEIIPSTLLKNQLDVWTSFEVNVHKFLDDMRHIYTEMNDEDVTNIKILLMAENDSLHDPLSNNDYLSRMPTNALSDFGKRFGPWDKIVAKVREFVSDGARDWFIGKCNGSKAAELLSLHSNDCFCIRSVPLDQTLINDHTYAFALSLWKEGKISHLRIFKDKQHRLCSLDETATLQYVHSFKEIIKQVLENASQPVGDIRFVELSVKENYFYESNIIPNNNIIKIDYIPMVPKN